MRKTTALVRVVSRTEVFTGVSRALDAGTSGRRRVQRGGKEQGLGWRACFVSLTCNGIAEMEA